MVLTGRQKATILLSLLGTEISNEILKLLPEGFSDIITSGMNSLPMPSTELVSSVLEEFSGFMTLPAASAGTPQQSQQPNPVPGQNKPQKAAAAETQRSPYDILFYSQPRKVAAALSAERSWVVAYVMSILPPVQGKEVISYMSERKSEVERMIKLLKNPPVSSQIKEKIVKILSGRLERLSLN